MSKNLKYLDILEVPSSRLITRAPAVHKSLIRNAKLLCRVLVHASFLTEAACLGHHFHANMARIRKSRPDAGLGFQVKALKNF